MSRKKNLPDFEFVRESYGRFTEGPPSYVFRRLKTARIQGVAGSEVGSGCGVRGPAGASAGGGSEVGSDGWGVRE